MAWFYEIRSNENAVLKRDGGFANRDAAKMAALTNAKRMKQSWKPGEPQVERVMVGQNVDKPTR